MPLTVEAVNAALSQVNDPEHAKPVTELGMMPPQAYFARYVASNIIQHGTFAPVLR